MLQVLFGLMLGGALLYGLITGRGDQTAAAVLNAAGDAVKTALNMAGMFAVFCGMAQILRKAGAAKWLAKRLSPALKWLLGPSLSPDALEYAVMNLTMNALGLGNAATPLGLQAARRMADGAEAANNALCLFLVINASSVQVMPSTVIALRAASGAQNPGAIILPSLLATGVSTLVGILACKGAEKIR